MTTVKSTEVAHTEANKMLGIINNQLPGLIGQLNSHGQQLSDPNNWDGPLAQRFRGEVWPQASRNLEKMKHDLYELQHQVQNILTNITHAGS